MLRTCHLQGFAETRFSLDLIIHRLLEQECAFEAVYLGLIPTVPGGSRERQCFREQCESCFWLPEDLICLGEECKPIRSKDLGTHLARDTLLPQSLAEMA